MAPARARAERHRSGARARIWTRRSDRSRRPERHLRLETNRRAGSRTCHPGRGYRLGLARTQVEERQLSAAVNRGLTRREPPERRLSGLRLLDEHGEGIERRPHLVERHVAALEAEPPEPPHRRSLPTLRLVGADEQGDSEGVFEVDDREVRGLRTHRREVAPLEGVIEPTLRTALNRRERTVRMSEQHFVCSAAPSALTEGGDGGMMGPRAARAWNRALPSTPGRLPCRTGVRRPSLISCHRQRERRRRAVPIRKPLPRACRPEHRRGRIPTPVTVGEAVIPISRRGITRVRPGSPQAEPRCERVVSEAGRPHGGRPRGRWAAVLVTRS